jgi:hypothetical protein
MRAITTDLYEAAFLVCVGQVLAETWLDQGRGRAAVSFVFVGDDQLDAHQRGYRVGTAVVNVADFRRQLHALRDRIRDLTTPDISRRNPEHAATNRTA